MSEPPPATKVVVLATSENLEALHGLLDAFYATFDRASAARPSLSWQNCLNTAVLEIGGNVIRYAYPTMGPVGNLSFTLRRFADRVEACLSDQGIAFAEQPTRNEFDPDDVRQLPEGGFGLALARECVDELSYQRLPSGTNCWILVKKLTGK